MGANIELWKYRLFKNNSLYLEEIYHNKPKINNLIHSAETNKYKNPVMVEAGKKAAQTRATATYTMDEHIENKKNLENLINIYRDYILNIDSSIEEIPKKNYIAYKVSQNIACVRIENKVIKFWLKLKPTDIENPPRFYRNVTSIGHWGTGDVEFVISNEKEFVEIKKYIKLDYDKVG